MRPRKLKINVSLGGMRMPIATVTIKNFAKLLEAKTELVCPKCGKKPTWIGGYTCTCCSKCGKPMEAVPVDEKGTINYKCPDDGWQSPSYFKTWQDLKRILPDGTELTKERLNPEGEEVQADAFIMDIPEFSKFADATLNEYGVIVRDETSARNLKKLLIAMHNLGKVILLHFNDTYEERVCILTTSISNRIILKELIPQNLADIQETMKVSLDVTDKEIAEAEAFIKQLPHAEEDLLYVHDYRIKGIETPKVSPKVLELEAIMSKQAQQ
jgi:hypothetical protein